MAGDNFDAQGHRGARGLLPENTLPAFARAIALGVTTLELDLGVSRDNVLVVMHDSRLNPDIARDRNGQWIDGATIPVHSLTVAELRRFDVGRLRPGSRYAARLPDQAPVDGTPMPTLDEVLALAGPAASPALRFNIETKISPDAADETPPPEQFAALVVAAIRQHGVVARASVQSFDWRTLAAVRRLAPEIATVHLSAQQSWLDNIQAGRPGPSAWTAGLDVDDFGGSVAALVKAAGGAIWSPHWRDLSPAALTEAHRLGLTVVVWTVNEPSDMAALLDLGVDGIITDHPDRLIARLADKGYRRDPASGYYVRSR